MKAVPFVFTTADSTRTGGKERCDGNLGKRRALVGITKRPMDKHFVRDVEPGGAWHALKRLLRHRPTGSLAWARWDPAGGPCPHRRRRPRGRHGVVRQPRIPGGGRGKAGEPHGGSHQRSRESARTSP